MATGNLIVRARAGRGALPVAGAVVTVYCPQLDGSSQPCVTVRTDLSGSTEVIVLEAPEREGMSNTQVPPYTAYRVDIDHPDYRPVSVKNVAIFSGITTTLPVTMTPPRTVEEQSQCIVINSEETGPTGSGTVGG